jgi:nitroreductase
MTNIQSTRTPEANVASQFLERWSPRSFSTDPLEPGDVASLFEAARWAPSCFNAQPWLFVYGAGGEDHARIAALLMEGNRTWAEKAPVLGIVFAKRAFEGDRGPNRWAQFDAGAASVCLALQARELGLAAHFMGGFDAAASYAALGVAEDEYEAMAAFAVGRPGSADALPEALRAREAPSTRKPLSEVATAGRFRG